MLLAAIGLCMNAGKPRRVAVSADDAARADYIFLEALRHRAIGNDDAFAILTARAHELNPLDKTIGLYHGITLIRMSDGDSADVADGLNLVGAYVTENPDDETYARSYAAILGAIHDTEAERNVWQMLHTTHPTRPEYAYRLARIYARGDSTDTQRALAIYDSLQVTEGRSVGLTSNKIQLLYQLDDTTAMLRELHALLDSSPRSVDNCVFAGEVFNALEMPDSALWYLDRACALDSTNGMAFYSRAEFYRLNNDSTAYDREIFNALERESLDIDVKVELMRSYVINLSEDSTQHDRITSLFNGLIDRHPHQPDIHGLYARYLINRKDYAGAAEQQSYVVDLEPDDFDGWEMLISLYTTTKQWDKALDATRRAERYFSDRPALIATHAALENETGNPAEAIALYRKAISLTEASEAEDISALYTGIGDVYYLMGDKDSAFVNYYTAIELDPDNYSALNNCAYNMAIEGRDLQRALEMIKKVVDNRPDDANGLDTYAWVLFKLRRYPEAKDAIDRTMEKTVDLNAEVLEHAGDIYFMNGEPEQALDFWQEALKTDPDNEMLRKKVKNRTYFFK